MPLAYLFSVICVLPAAFIVPPLYDYLPEWIEKVGLFFATIFLMGGFAIIEDGQISILSSTLLLIPYYYLSVNIESKVLSQHFPTVPTQKIKSAAIHMNRLTYLILGTLLILLYYTT